MPDHRVGAGNQAVNAHNAWFSADVMVISGHNIGWSQGLYGQFATGFKDDDRDAGHKKLIKTKSLPVHGTPTGF